MARILRNIPPTLWNAASAVAVYGHQVDHGRVITRAHKQQDLPGCPCRKPEPEPASESESGKRETKHGQDVAGWQDDRTFEVASRDGVFGALDFRVWSTKHHHHDPHKHCPAIAWVSVCVGGGAAGLCRIYGPDWVLILARCPIIETDTCQL